MLVFAAMSSHAIRARVEDGRVIVDEKTDLPDGEVYLIPVDVGEMSAEERDRLEEVIEESIADEKAGRVEDFFAVVGELRAQR
jgi:hypothetical protein